MTIVIFILVCIAVYLWFVLPHERAMEKKEQEVEGLREKLDDQENATYKISEEKVIQRETRFNKHFETTYLPDAPSGVELYIYSKLMKPWYDKLSSKNRYNEEFIGKLRTDWNDYMWAVDEQNSSIFLSMELYSNDKERADEYGDKAEQNGRKKWAIEDAFAAALGKEATEELERIRNKNRTNSFYFDRNGNLAPDGFIYNSSYELVPIEGVYNALTDRLIYDRGAKKYVVKKRVDQHD